MLDSVEVGNTEELFDDETGKSWLALREIELSLLLVTGGSELIPVGRLEMESLLKLILRVEGVVTVVVQ